MKFEPRIDPSVRILECPPRLVRVIDDGVISTAERAVPVRDLASLDLRRNDADESPLLATAMLSICVPGGALTVTVMRTGVLIWPGASIEP